MLKCQNKFYFPPDFFAYCWDLQPFWHRIFDDRMIDHITVAWFGSAFLQATDYHIWPLLSIFTNFDHFLKLPVDGPFIICNIYLCVLKQLLSKRSCNSAVSLVTGLLTWKTKESFDFQQRQEIFLFSKVTRLAPRPTQRPAYLWLFPWGLRHTSHLHLVPR
jgi:hypothetical protein